MSALLPVDQDHTTGRVRTRCPELPRRPPGQSRPRPRRWPADALVGRSIRAARRPRPPSVSRVVATSISNDRGRQSATESPRVTPRWRRWWAIWFAPLVELAVGERSLLAAGHLDSDTLGRLGRNASDDRRAPRARGGESSRPEPKSPKQLRPRPSETTGQRPTGVFGAARTRAKSASKCLANHSIVSRSKRPVGILDGDNGARRRAR